MRDRRGAVKPQMNERNDGVELAIGRARQTNAGRKFPPLKFGKMPPWLRTERSPSPFCGAFWAERSPWPGRVRRLPPGDSIIATAIPGPVAPSLDDRQHPLRELSAEGSSESRIWCHHAPHTALANWKKIVAPRSSNGRYPFFRPSHAR